MISAITRPNPSPIGITRARSHFDGCFLCLLRFQQGEEQLGKLLNLGLSLFKLTNHSTRSALSLVLHSW